MPRLLELSEHALTLEGEVAWVLDRELRIAAVSPAWDRFALANGGLPRVLAREVIGTPWLDSIKGEQPRALFAGLAAAALGLRDAVAIKGLRMASDCNTPALRRQISTMFAPVLDDGAPLGLFVRSSIIAEAPLHQAFRVRGLSDVHFEGELIRQCSSCRRVRTNEGRWELVPALIASTPRNVSHGFCDSCASLVYGM